MIMYKKIIINSLLIFCSIIFQIGFIYGLPIGLKNLNVVLVAIIFILGFNSFELALGWAVGAGILLDIYLFMPFGVNTISLIASLTLINFLLANFFTNRSLYSFLLLILITTISFNFSIILLNYLVSSFSERKFDISLNLNLLINQLSGILLNFICVIVVFYLLSFLSERYKPVFLKSK